jgi:hypothetical protein
LRRLVEDKHVLAIDEPLSVRPTKPALYRVADSSLRSYLAIGRAAHELSRRGRATAAGTLITRRWASWRGRAVEPVIREALSLAAADLPWPEAVAVGGWWNRAFDPPLVPGFDPGETVLIGVSCTGFTDSATANLALGWLPGDIIRAFA